MRVSAGAAFWVIAGCAALAVADALQRLRAGALLTAAVVTALCAGIASLALSGYFDALSIAREYSTRHALFAAAFSRHIALVAGSVGPALAIGFPLGVAAARKPNLQGPLFAGLNLLQTIPSIALFGLLIIPLSALANAVPQLAALGVGGIGPAPAIIALILYALLPIVRNTNAGISGVDPAVIDAARGVGLTQRQIFWRIEFPLSLPILMAGLRVVTVQTIGLAVVAALIGAGGLGTFVFEGLGQYALDLVLLGALPAIGLALTVDFLLRLVSRLLLRAERLMIELEGVTKRYDGRTVVDDLSLSIPTGEFCVLLGSSGCGKSTTLRMINRLVMADAGHHPGRRRSNHRICRPRYCGGASDMRSSRPDCSRIGRSPTTSRPCRVY